MNLFERNADDQVMLINACTSETEANQDRNKNCTYFVFMVPIEAMGNIKGAFAEIAVEEPVARRNYTPHRHYRISCNGIVTWNSLTQVPSPEDYPLIDVRQYAWGSKRFFLDLSSLFKDFSTATMGPEDRFLSVHLKVDLFPTVSETNRFWQHGVRDLLRAALLEKNSLCIKYLDPVQSIYNPSDNCEVRIAGEVEESDKFFDHPKSTLNDSKNQ